MPITADLGGKNYTFGRGKVFFDRFVANAVVGALTRGEGERYLGNTPEFNNASESENLDHFDSDAGVRVKDDSVQLSFEQTANFTCDNISSENIALYFLGDREDVTVVGATGIEETITVRRGRFYQLGMTESNPAGARKITAVTAVDDADAAITASGNFQVDETRGRIYIEDDATDIADDDEITVTYTTQNSTRERVVSGSQSIYGALRFVADNPKGPNRDYYYPYVKLAPDGDYSLKGDDWQTMGFTVEVLKKASNVASLYVDGQPV